MAKKIKSDGSGIDEANRTMYAAFCNAANSLSQLYTQAESQQKLAFQAGERHSLEKMYQWILRQEEDGKRITASDVIFRLQEFNYIGEISSMPLGYQWQQPQNLNSHMCHPTLTTQTDYGSVELSTGQTMRPLSMEQTRQSVCVNVLPCPARNHAQLSQMTSRAGLEPGLENGGFDPEKCSSPDGMGHVSSTHNFLQYAHQVHEVGILDFHETAMDI
ncbi:uncharacterized protein LOC116249132 [Nymphaea colorata]|nr:uncharacterized protein LOC116249132 [Nymphaea colorata]